MGEMITKPDANPILLAVLNLIPVPIGYFMLGQTKKAVIALLLTWVFSLCFGLGFLLCFVWAYDAYLLGQKLQSGESIADNENGLDLLNNVPGFN